MFGMPSAAANIMSVRPFSSSSFVARRAAPSAAMPIPAPALSRRTPAAFNSETGASPGRVENIERQIDRLGNRRHRRQIGERRHEQPIRIGIEISLAPRNRLTNGIFRRHQMLQHDIRARIDEDVDAFALAGALDGRDFGCQQIGRRDAVFDIDSHGADARQRHDKVRNRFGVR